MAGSEEPPVQGPTRGDFAYSILRGLVASIPFAGGVLSEVGSTAIPSPAQRRLDAWMRTVSERLATLETSVEGFNVERLNENAAFADALAQAAQSAIRDSDGRKLEALRNAVVNSALPNPVEESRQGMFLEMVDSFTPLHLQILQYLADPVRAFATAEVQLPSYMAGSLFNQLVVLRPELGEEREMCNAIVSDLYRRGLLPMDSIQGGMTGGGLRSPHITALGRGFLKFISAP